MQTHRKIIIGNWKMHPTTSSQAKKLFLAIKKAVAPFSKVDVVLAVPAVYLSILKPLASKRLMLAAQNMFSLGEGAYTGEISPLQLLEFGIKYVILGHSERRAQGEDNVSINKKVLAALKYHITPVLCVGETNRNNDVWYLHMVKTQLEECLANVRGSDLKHVVLAYEPVWAIGVDAVREATPVESEEMSIYIRKVIVDLYGAKYANLPRIIYGGSADEKDAGNFLHFGAVDGLLPGRASLDPKKFTEMVRIAQEM